MTRNAIFNELKSILKQIKPDLDVTAISPESRLLEDLGLDSLTILLLSFAIEKNFDFKFDGAGKFINVNEVIDYIEKNVAK